MTKRQTLYFAKIPLIFYSAGKTLFLFLVSFISINVRAQVTQTFTYTGAAQSFTVPSCVNTLTVSLAGANGGDGLNSSVGPGGKGGSLTAVITVSPGQILNLYVGGVGGAASTTTAGTGGYNGGAAGAYYSTLYSGGGGGGASDIRKSPYALSDRIAVAGGGGGGSKYGTTNNSERGGNGGGTTGESGYFFNSNTSGQGGGGGTALAGGVGGINVTFCTANSGSLGLGGSANACSNGGGGGGGGYYGGGGGIFAGGGGGTSYVVAGSSNIVHAQGSNSGNGTIVIKYQQILVAPIISSAGTNTICAGTTIDLSIPASFAVTSYSWNTGANTPTITVTPTSAMIYTLTATDGTCNIISSSSITTVPAIPSLTIVNSTSGNSYGVCPNKNATLTASGAVSYTWTGLNTVTNDVSFTPTVASTYTIIGENACGTSSAVTSVSIHPNPVVGITALTGSICSGNTTTISVTGNSNSHTITTAVSAPQITSNVGFQPAITNTYNVLGSSIMGCTSTANTSVQVVQTPTLAPTSTTLILCIGQSATLSASGATGGYTWTTGSTTISTSGNTIQVIPNSTTTYSVTKNSSTCFDTKAISIQVNSLPPAFAGATQTVICASKPATLTAFGGIAYTWYSSATPTVPFSNATNPVVSPSVTTTYTVAASDGTCINTAAVTVSTNPNPTINIVTTSTNVCIGSAVSLTATGGQGTTYTWTAISPPTNITGQDVIFPSFPGVGAYAFSATGDNVHSCTNTAVQIILVNQPPTLNANATKTLICSGGLTTLNVTGADIYQWDLNANNAATATTVVNPSSNIVYIVSGTVTSTQCSASTSVAVSIYTPSLSITSPTNTCFGAAFTLTGSVNNPASGSINSYTWNVPGSSNSNGTSVLVTPTVLTIYTLSAKSTTMGSTTCIETKTTSVGIFYNPTITATPSRTYVCRNDQVELVGQGAESYTWNGGAYTGSLISVSHNTIGTVAYTVAGTDTNGCKNDTIFYLKINGCQGIAEQSENYVRINVYPNPNKGQFNIVGEGDLKLKLINGLGQVIREFELNAYNEYKVQVADLPKGIYFISASDNQAVTRQKIIVR